VEIFTIQVELGNDTTYPITKMSFLSFRMPSGNVLELNDVLSIPGLTKNLVSVSCMIDLQCVVEFDDQQVIIRKHNLDSSQALARGVCEGGLYRLLVDPRKHDALV
jgi:hypothetical protein